MNIGIIGSGEMGSCLAAKLAALGHTVLMANSKGPLEEITKNKDLVIVSIPVKNIPPLKKLFAGLDDNVIVIDTGNYYPTLRDGIIPALEQSGVDSLWVQKELGVPIVKVFSSILATSLKDMGKPRGDKNRISLAVSGDDAKAKQVVCTLVDELGFDAFDIGNITQSWKQQPGSPIYCRDINLQELKKRITNMETEPDMHNIIISQRKTDEALMKADYPAYLKALQN